MNSNTCSMTWELPKVLAHVHAHAVPAPRARAEQHKLSLCPGWWHLCPAQPAHPGHVPPEPSAEPAGHAALLHHTFVVMTSDPITALWKRPRRAFRAADHTGEPGELAADRFIGFSPIKMLFIAFRRGLFVSNFRRQFGKWLPWQRVVSMGPEIFQWHYCCY